MTEPVQPEPSRPSDSSLTPETLLGLMNLHDALLNADMVWTQMRTEPIPEIDKTLEGYLALSAIPHFRYERLWVALLAVLVEAWESRTMEPVRRYVASITDSSVLERMINSYRTDGRLERMRSCRHYMFHRDRREYWDAGRHAPVGLYEDAEGLYKEFSRVLTTAMQAAVTEHERRGLRMPGPSDASFPWPEYNSEDGRGRS